MCEEQTPLFLHHTHRKCKVVHSKSYVPSVSHHTLPLTQKARIGTFTFPSSIPSARDLTWDLQVRGRRNLHRTMAVGSRPEIARGGSCVPQTLVTRSKKSAMDPTNTRRPRVRRTFLCYTSKYMQRKFLLYSILHPLSHYPYILRPPKTVMLLSNVLQIFLLLLSFLSLAFALAPTQSPTVTQVLSLQIVGDSTIEVQAMFTQTFTKTALGTWPLGTEVKRGTIGLGDIAGSVGGV